ncbi:MAG: DUF4955 domain-containing protein, partial [Cytophagales bacterium]|nr:DUF4955 domain-containing protein [Cytophagales bacterium]
ARSIELMEGSGFEDIHFKANFFDNYVHHQHVGWAFMKLERTAHSWVRRVRISNVISIMAVRNSYAVSVIQLLVDGNRGHTTVGTVVSTRILTGLTWDNTNNSQWHGSGFATGANGSVVWRVDATKGESHDLHGDKPRTNLIDLYTSVDLTGNGGAVQNFPHHLSGLTIWNQKRVGGSSVNNYNVWGSGWWLVNPIIVGMHGTNTTFVQSSLKYEESNGAAVTPASLYEAQLEHRLGSKPAWVDAAIAEYESLKTAWYVPADPEPVAGVTVSPTTYTLGLGLTIDLTETIYPSNAANKAVSWSSSNTSVATVNSDGLVMAVAEGNATITVTTADGGFTATSTVTVTPVTGISVSPALHEAAGINIYPNPVNKGELNVGLTLSSGNDIALRIFNIMGRLVYSETIGSYGPGSYTCTRDTHMLNMHTPGVYIIEVNTNGVAERKKVILR